MSLVLLFVVQQMGAITRIAMASQLTVFCRNRTAPVAGMRW